MPEERYAVQSQSDPEKAHCVEWADYSWICDCPGYGFRGYCIHVASVEVAGHRPAVRRPDIRVEVRVSVRRVDFV